MGQVTIDSSILPRVKRLLEHYQKGDIPLPLEHEVHPNLPLDSRDNYLYFTLPVCINFQRSSPAMWRSALETYEDPETRYLFYPERLAKTPLEKIRVDMVKHKLALQPNKHVLIWTTIAQSLHEFYNDDPREILKESKCDAKLLIHNLHTVNRKRFPYLSGPKHNGKTYGKCTEYRAKHGAVWVDEEILINQMRKLLKSIELPKKLIPSLVAEIEKNHASEQELYGY